MELAELQPQIAEVVDPDQLLSRTVPAQSGPDPDWSFQYFMVYS